MNKKRENEAKEYEKREAKITIFQIYECMSECRR